MAETEERDTPDVVTADFAYYRYRKPTYTAEERQAMGARIHEHLAAGRDVFAYFKHEETPEGALYAVDLLRAGAAKDSEAAVRARSADERCLEGRVLKSRTITLTYPPHPPRYFSGSA